MGDLKTKAQNILTEKNTKIIPSNIKEGITIFDVTGSYNGDTELQEKDVNFYDYDGTLVYSYTANEFLALTELPANPTHQGLTAQGWNWTLQEAKDFVTEYGECDIGQQYITDDGKTRIYITLAEGRTSPYLSFYGASNSTIEVDWGDGNVETVTGKGTSPESNLITLLHNYITTGNYIITLKSINNKQISIPSVYRNYGYYPCFLSPVPIAEINSSNTATPYLAAITKIEFGENIAMQSNSLNSFINMRTITTRKGMNINNVSFTSCLNLVAYIYPYTNASHPSQMFYNCYSLKKIIYSPLSRPENNECNNCSIKKIICPTKTTSLLSNAFTYMYNLQKIILPNTLTSLSTYCISRFYNLTYLDIPKGISNIPTYTFSDNTSMLYYNFSKHEAVPTLANINAFSNIPADCKIVVPDNLYEDWIVAQNWSDIASHIVKASEYFS